MTPLVPISLFGWIPFVLWLFRKYEPRKASLIGFVLAWCFLPNYSYKIPAIPALDKLNAACYGILLGCYLYDKKSFKNLKCYWVDLPMIALCSVSFFSSVTNGLGAYDGLSETLSTTARYGFPYLVGRIYFTRFPALRDLAEAVFFAGLLYAPFCLYESKMSPQLHQFVYGFRTFGFTQVVRLGGFRPVVFMEHGLMTGMWMSSALLCGLWLILFKCIRPTLLGYPIKAWLGLQTVATLFCRSSGALILFVIGSGILFAATRLRLKVMLLILLIVPLLYVGTRATGAWDGKNVVAKFAQISEERAQSLDFRFVNENILVEKALMRPIVGWGGWGRSRVYDEEGKDVSVTDGLWIILFGTKGFVGLGGFLGAMLLPGVLFLWRTRNKPWTLPHLAPVALLCTLVGLSTIDNLLNAMYNPLFLIIAGGVGGCMAEYRSAVSEVECGGALSEGEPAPAQPVLRVF